jgi:hypothetical protein
MKKLFALMLAMVFVVTTTSTVQAQTIQVASSFDFTMEMSISLDVQAPDLPAEAELVLEFLEDVTLEARGTVIEDTENLAAHVFMEVDINAGPFYIPFSFWMDLDFSDLEDIVYVVVVEVPEMLRALIGLQNPELVKPYWVIDYSVIFEQDPEMLLLMTTMFDLAESLAGAGVAMDILPEMEAVGENEYRMTISDEWLVASLRQIVEDMFSMLFGEDMLLPFLNTIDPGLAMELAEADLELESMKNEMWSEFEILLDVLSNVTLFAEDWVTYYVLDEDGFVVQENSSFQFIFDMMEWAHALAYVDSGFNVEDFPELTITLDVEYTIVYENINAAERVEMPELTAENSVDVMGLMGF